MPKYHITMEIAGFHFQAGAWHSSSLNRALPAVAILILSQRVHQKNKFVQNNLTLKEEKPGEVTQEAVSRAARPLLRQLSQQSGGAAPGQAKTPEAEDASPTPAWKTFPSKTLISNLLGPLLNGS